MRFLAVLSTAALATAVSFLPGTQAAEQSSFSTTKRSTTPATTPGWNDFECRPTAEHPNPLIMLHGLGSQGERHWKVFAPQFVAKGHCVFTPTYGSLHGQTFINGLDDIENSAHQIAAYIDLVLAATGASKVNILAHSEGSTVGQYYLLKLGGGPKVDRWSAIGGNFYGSTFIGLSKVLDKLGLRDLAHKTFGPLVPSLFQLLEGSEFFKKLNSNGDTVPGVQYYNLVSRYDEYVVESGFMKDNNPNVHNVYLQDLCPTNRAWHFDLLKDPVVFHAVSEFFDGNADTEVGCGPFA